MAAGYILLVRDDSEHDGGRLHRGPVYFVGRRDSLASVLDDVELYARDPIAPGHFFAVAVNARGVVTWSNDWCAVVDASLSGHIGRRDLGPDTFGDVEHILSASLLSLEGARAAA